MSLPIYFDIDGTLTEDREGPWGKPNMQAIERLRILIAHEQEVVLWSGRGTAYAREFSQRWGLACVAVGKPKFCYDDNPEIRPGGLRVQELETL